MQNNSAEFSISKRADSDAQLAFNLETPSSFTAFPYSAPYPIQLELMRHLYSAIESRNVAVVESPTGTGKTLSLLCATLTWLNDNRARIRKGKVRALVGDLDDGEPEWVREQTTRRLKNTFLQAELEMGDRLREAKQKETDRKRAHASLGDRRTRGVKRRMEQEEHEEHDDREYLLCDLEGNSDDFVSETLRKVLQATRLPEQVESSPSECGSGVKIYFASRTHSQLGQVISELARIDMQVFSLHEQDHHSRYVVQDILPHPRTVSLASRKHLCINDQLRSQMSRKGHGGDMDDACRDLRKETGCPHLPVPGTDSRMEDTRDAILATPKDIEDLVSSGKTFNSCPYYAARMAVPSAEVVALPYNLLLNANSRQALDINLKDQIVVIDEAHNLPETLLSLHAVELTATAIRSSTSAAEIYLKRFKTRLGAVHALHLTRFVRFLKEVEAFLGAKTAEKPQIAMTPGDSRPRNATANPPKTDVITVSAFLEEVGRAVDGINFLELKLYLQNSKAAQKISAFSKTCALKGFVTKGHVESASKSKNALSTEIIKGTDEIRASALYTVEAFLCALMNDKEDGRVIIDREDNGTQRTVRSIRYQHLNPATYFADIVSEARCVILAGGTMSPISDMAAQLFPTAPKERISLFTCGHIIPPANLRCIVVKKGPKGRDIVLKFGQRDSDEMLDEIGQLLSNLVTLVPKGLVIFFPSYSFLENAKTFWSKNGLLERLSRKKSLFYEPQTTSDVDTVLQSYSQAVHDNTIGTGALLMAVVGAKLSEGLNFADDLARGVVVVGLPYPNLASIELKERMKYVSEQRSKMNGVGKANSGGDAGAELYENLCMRAVNQSIGRAIRHRDDWATLILVDARYASPRVRGKLPRWINESTVITETFGQVVKELSSFYKSKRK